MARTCAACGRANDDAASFCQGCGAAVTAAAQQAPPAPPMPPAADPPATSPPPRGGHTPGWVVVLVVAVVIAIAAVAALLILPRGKTTAGEDASLTPTAGATVGVSTSPSLGQYLAGAVGPKADRLAAITADGTVKPIARFSGQQIRQIAYSPDGRWLACVAGTSGSSELWLFDAAGGAGRQATAGTPHVVAVDSIAWLSATELLVAEHGRTPPAPGRNADFLIYDTAAQDFAPLVDATGAPLHGVAVSASRDGGRVAFVTYTDVEEGGDGMVTASERLDLLDRTSGAVTELGRHKALLDAGARAFDEPLISPSGEAVIYRRVAGDTGASYTVVAADGAVLMPARETRFPAGCAWDPDGVRVVFTGHSREPSARSSDAGPAVFWIFDTRSGSTQAVARYPHTMVQDLSWSPDGKTIAWAEYAGDGRRTGNVRLTAADGGDARTLTHEALSPVWAPGGAPSLQTSPDL
jgi:WD40 repeat protein